MAFKLNLSGYGRKPRRTIPATIENMLQDQRFITSYITEIYGLEEEDVVKIGVKNRSCVGIKGNLSDSSRLSITVKLRGGVTNIYNWFVKLLPTYNENNILINEFNIFKNEIEFYTKIVPEFKKMMEDQNLKLELDIPEILLAKENTEGAIIILRDLAEDGYRQDRDQNGDRFLSYEQAVAAVGSMAKIQAVSMAYQLTGSRSLEKEHPILQEVGLMWASDSISDRLASMKETYCDALSKSPKPDSPTLLKRFKQQFDSSDRLKELCQQRVNKEGNEEVLCLQHGDFHFNNLLFRQDAQGAFKVMIVDWQLTYTGRRLGDISYLLMSSLSQDMRETHQEQIKQHYCQVFNETLELFDKKSGFDSQPEGGEFDEEYTKSLPLSFFLSCGNVMFQKEEKLGANKTKVEFSYDICREAAEKEII